MKPGRAAGKILVVDDHVDLAENLAEILAGAGYEAVIAASAEAGLDRIARGDIAAVITDYRLPGRNGVELIAEIRRQGKRIPAVVISAFTDESTIDQALAAGAADVLPKPVELDRLMALVASMSRDDAVVVLVEDNRELAENLVEILSSRGHPAAICGSVAEVRALAATPEVAVLDYRLPDGNGVEAAEALLARNARIRLLFLSGYVAELQAGLRHGPAATAAQLAKPVDAERLLAWVAEALGRGSAERPRR